MNDEASDQIVSGLQNHFEGPHYPQEFFPHMHFLEGVYFKFQFGEIRS